MEEIKCQLFCLMFECFVAGALFMTYVNPNKTKPIDKKTDVLKNLKLYCFNCEIKMPVKEEKGCLRCSNCGLYHGKIE